jgi:hypothetical protein
MGGGRQSLWHCWLDRRESDGGRRRWGLWRKPAAGESVCLGVVAVGLGLEAVEDVEEEAVDLFTGFVGAGLDGQRRAMAKMGGVMSGVGGS